MILDSCKNPLRVTYKREHTHQRNHGIRYVRNMSRVMRWSCKCVLKRLPVVSDAVDHTEAASPLPPTKDKNKNKSVNNVLRALDFISKVV